MMQMLGYALLVILALSTPAAAVYYWNGCPLTGDAAGNAAYAYNSTVATGTINDSVYIGCGHGADYATPLNR